MQLPKKYLPQMEESAISNDWLEYGTYHFDQHNDVSPVYSIDTPPPTVSGKLHLGHVFSYTHADIIARFHRMCGENVFYPMGFDDNGLPTERLVEREEKVHARTIGRAAFIQRCLKVSEREEEHYRQLWQRLGLSVDWRYSYRTISFEAQREAQYAFIENYNADLIYRTNAPTLWCTECETAVAQADLADLVRDTTMHTISFAGTDGINLRIATTRPELLPACVAVFIHPGDKRYKGWAGSKVQVPLFDHWVPVLEDAAADPDKGTGAVMCCTFGDVTDVNWWYKHNLPLRLAIDKAGRMLPLAGEFANIPVDTARIKIVDALKTAGLLVETRDINQSIRVHERCDTPIEYIVTKQWFVRVMAFKKDIKEIAHKVDWHPPHMKGRMLEWIDGLRWDWCLSRQRYYGVPFPLWHCNQCGAVKLASIDELPVDPTEMQPNDVCICGSGDFSPETDVMDTWATSSLSPQIVGKRLSDPILYNKVFPFSLRPQAHEIIRTWAFYTLVQSWHHSKTPPWKHAGISGWGLAPEGQGKISKSRGGGPMSPMDMIALYSADAVRYWASSTGFGKDAVINKEKIKAGAKLVTKLYNVARFCEPFIQNEVYPQDAVSPQLSPADRWILSKMHRCIFNVTELLTNYDYAAAKNEVESFFWHDLADNYIEMAKLRIYDQDQDVKLGPAYTLDVVLLNILKLLAPFLPYITEKLYQALYAERSKALSIHKTCWPDTDSAQLNGPDSALGDNLVTAATMVRRYKSDQALSLGHKLAKLTISSADSDLLDYLKLAKHDLMSVTRACELEFTPIPEDALDKSEKIRISVEI